MFSLSPMIWTLLVVFLTAYCVPVYMQASRSPINKIPTVGPSGVITSYFGILMMFWKAKDMIDEGYRKYHGGTFKVPMMARWLVIVSGPQLFDEVRRAGDDEMSFYGATDETLQTEFTLGKSVKADPYHVKVVRTPLTQNLDVRFADVQDEIAAAFSEHIPAREGDWLSIPACDTILQIVSRTSNRLFVGLPLCRDPDFRKLNIEFTIEVMKSAMILGQFPLKMRGPLGKLFTSIDANVARATRYLGPIIEERLERYKQYGSEDSERPNDLISWLVDAASPEGRTVYELTMRILTVNFAAIHTTSMAFTHVLYDLAAHPEYVEPLREELLSVLTKGEWSRVQMNELRKLDSFIKESQRLSASNAIIMNRVVVKDITLSDGTFIPKGHYIAFPSRSTHLDERVYPNPHEFQGFRFSDMTEGEDETSKRQCVSLGMEWTLFGGGKHACPGRFFAVNEIKAMLAHLLLNYDVKLEGGVRPETFWFGVANIPNQKAKVLFRRRKGVQSGI